MNPSNTESNPKEKPQAAKANPKLLKMQESLGEKSNQFESPDFPAAKQGKIQKQPSMFSESNFLSTEKKNEPEKKRSISPSFRVPKKHSVCRV
jgi:hypothetical protein